MVISNFMTAQPGTGKKLLKQLLKLALVLIVLYFVYRQLKGPWADVVAYDWSIHYGMLLLSVVLHLITFVLFSQVWCILIGAFGFKVRLLYAFKISYIANLGRYIPGKIWPVMGMSYLAKQLHVTEESAVVSWIVAQVFTLPSAFLASLVCILISPHVFQDGLLEHLDWTVYVMTILVFLASIVLIAIPNKIFLLVNKLLVKLKRPVINLRMDFKTAMKVYFGYFLCWLLYGFSFWVFIRSIASSETVPVIPAMGAFIIAYQLGYLAFFAPGGIGIRELVLTTVMMPYLGPLSAGIAVAARLWNLLTEIFATVIAFSIKFPKK